MHRDAFASPLAVEIERDGDTATVRCRGKLVAGVNDILYAKVSPLIPECRRIVLDLTDLTHMDSMGLGTVVRLYVSSKSPGKPGGCDLQLVNLGKRIRQLLAATNLAALFGITGAQGITII